MEPWILDLLACLVALAAALALRPWQMLRATPLQTPWLAALVLLPWVWSLGRLLPRGLDLQLSGACFLVLVLGWPLAIPTILLIAAVGGLLAGSPWQAALDLAAWNGVVPATLALGLGIALRRWAPNHIFIYILGRGFVGTVLAMMAAGTLGTLLHPLPLGHELDSLLTGRWLIAWGEGFATGMFTSIFVAFKPEWLATWSDRRYLPRAPRPGDPPAESKPVPPSIEVPD